jgi:coenzyme F420 hydrogenase subunit beta
MMNLGISLITESDLCISCGACQEACPQKAIRISFNARKGQFEPVIEAANACASCTGPECLSVCPSHEVDYPRLCRHTSPVTPLGPSVNLYTGHARDAQLRKKASSGAVIRSICSYLLEKDLADAVIALDHRQPMIYEYRNIHKAQEMEDLPGSIYHNVDFSSAIELVKNADRQTVLVGLPCHLTGFFKLAEKHPELKSKIRATIGLVCGWMYSHHAFWSFASYNAIDPQSIRSVTYRGDGKVGNLKLTTENGDHAFSRRPRIFDGMHYLNYRTSFSRSFNLKRCHFCRDHLNCLADIVVGDAWLEAFRSDPYGTSIIVTRTVEMDSLLHEMHEKNLLSIAGADIEDMEEAQSPDFTYGVSAHALLSRCRDENLPAPSFTLWDQVENRKAAFTESTNYLSRYQQQIRKYIRLRKYRLVRLLKAGEIVREFLSPRIYLSAASLIIHRLRQGARMKKTNGKKLHIVIDGGLCLAGNKGGPALVISLLDQLRPYLPPDTKFTIVVSREPDLKNEMKWAEIIGVEAVPHLPLYETLHVFHPFTSRVNAKTRAFLEAYRRADLVIACGGINYVGKPRPPHLWKSPFTSFQPLLVALRFGKPYLRWTQSYGPLTGWFNRLLAKFDLGRQKKIFCRGEHALEEVRLLLPRSDAGSFPDVANTLKYDPEQGKTYLARNLKIPSGSRIVTLSLSSVIFQQIDAPEGNRHIRCMAETVDWLKRSGYTVVFVPHTIYHTQNPAGCDLALTRAVLQNLEDRQGISVVEEDLSADVLKSIIACSDFHIGERYHSLVAALSTATPAIAIGWNPKYQDLMSLYGMQEFLFDPENLSAAGIIAALETIMDSRESIRGRLLERHEEVAKMVRENTRLFIEMMPVR